MMPDYIQEIYELYFCFPTFFVSEIVPSVAGTIYTLKEFDISHEYISAGDFITILVCRSSNNVNDTASSGAMAIMGAEFIYVAKVKTS